MTAVMTYNSSQTNWYIPNEVIDLFSNIHNQVIVFSGYVGQAFKIVSAKIDQNLIEKQINISCVSITPYQLDGYETFKPFVIFIRRIDDDEVIASFEEAGISFAAKNIKEAIKLLKAQLIYTYAAYKSAERLGPEPMRQLAILENYIGEKRRQ